MEARARSAAEQGRNAPDGAFRNRALHRLESVDALGAEPRAQAVDEAAHVRGGARRAASGWDCCSTPQGLDAARHQHDGLDPEARIDRLQPLLEEPREVLRTREARAVPTRRPKLL